MTTDQGKPTSQVVRARVSDHLRGAGYAVPLEMQSTLAVVVWRAKPCNCRVLRVFLTPDGWQLLGESFHISAEEWFERVAPDAPSHDGVPITLESYRAGLIGAFNLRDVEGIERMLPLDFTEWPTAKFEVGCDHGHEYRSVADVLADCEAVRATRAATKRDIEWQTAP